MRRPRYQEGGLTALTGVGDPKYSEDMDQPLVSARSLAYNRGGLAMAIGGVLDDDDDEYDTSPGTEIIEQTRAGIGQQAIANRDATLARLETARQAIMAQKPDPGAKWLALAQGMLTPTRTGSFGESLGTTAGLMGTERKERRAAERTQAAELRRIGEAEGAAETRLLTQQAGLLAKKAKPVTVGKDEVLVDPESGKIIYKGQFAEGLDLKDRILIERNFRNDFQRQSKDFIIQDSAYGRILETSKLETGPGDLALVFSFMKLQDPGSVVRESEFKTAEGARGALEDAEKGGEYVPSFLYAIVAKVFSGQTMTPVQRGQFLDAADGIYKDTADNHLSRENEFRRISKINKLNADIVVGDTMIRPIRGARKPGSSQDNPIVQTPGSERPASGLWVKLPPDENFPDGRVEQVQ